MSGSTSTQGAFPQRAAGPPRPVAVRAPRPGSANDRVLAAIAALVARLRLSNAAVAQLLVGDASISARVPRDELPRLVASLLDDGQVPDPRTLALIAERLGELTGQPLDASAVTTRRVRAAAATASAFAAGLAVLCGYLVLGGLLGGHSGLLGGASGLVAVAAFAALLAILGVFEALHISVTQLKTSDLSALADRHPRAVALHREFRTDAGIKRFLAGRQLVVVVTVFFVAGLSSFPGMDTLPGTGIAVPGVLRPFLDVGAPGALFVLWLGQLAPQFLATQRALRMMEARVVGVAFRAAMLLEAIGFARPGFWLSSWDHSSERIPSSPALRWSQSAHELDGTGVLTISREWSVSGESATLRADTAAALFAEDRGSYVDDSITLPPGANALAMSTDLEPGDGDRRRSVLGTGFAERRLPTGDRVLQKSALPAVGSLHAGDVVVTRLAAHFEGQVGRDAVLVDRPSRVLVWRLTLAEPTSCLPPARVTEVRDGEDGAVTTLQPAVDAEGRSCFEHTVAFPQPGTLFVFDWHAEF